MERICSLANHSFLCYFINNAKRKLIICLHKLRGDLLTMEINKGVGKSIYGNRSVTKDPPSRRIYFFILAAALLISLFCFDYWKREKRAILAELKSGAELLAQQTAGSVSVVLSEQAERGHVFAGQVSAAYARGAGDRALADLTRALLDDPDTLSARLVLEARAPRFDILYERRDGGVHRGTDSERFTGIDLAERGKILISPAVRSSLNFYALFGNSWELFSQTNVAKVSAPVRHGEEIVGWVEIDIALEKIERIFDGNNDNSRGSEIYLVGPGREIAAVSFGAKRSFLGMDYSELPNPEYTEMFDGCAVIAYKGKSGPFEAKVYGNMLAAGAPVSVGVGGADWLLVTLYNLRYAVDSSKGWLFVAFFVWLASILLIVLISAGRANKRSKAEMEAALKLLPAEEASVLRKLERRRKIYYVLAAFFCTPSVLFMQSADKLYKEAKAAGDIGAAEHAINRMTPVVVISVVIGIVFVGIEIYSRIMQP